MTQNATADRLRDLAQTAYDSMVSDERADGSRYARLGDDAPGWVAAIVRDAHGDMLPDDWRHECIHDAFGRIADSTADTADELDELGHEFADDADIYNADLLAWVGSSTLRGAFVDEATREYGEPRDFYHGLQMGQYAERAEVYAAVLQGLREVDTEYDEQEDAEQD